MRNVKEEKKQNLVKTYVPRSPASLINVD